MQSKYPKKPKLFINDEIYNALPKIDLSEDPDYDYIHNSKLYFEYDPTGRSYCRQIKRLLNYLILRSKEQLQGFKDTVKALFTLDSGRELEYAANMKFKETTPSYSS
jgi:hypothetical protein